MSERYGISITDDGTFICASLRSSRQSWKLRKVNRWNSQSFIKNYLLLHRAVSLAVRSHWIRNLREESSDVWMYNADAAFTVCTSRSEFDHFSQTIQNNLIATYPDDALLTTLPQHFAGNAGDSFISIFNDSNVIKIGIIFAAKLTVVFNVKATSRRELEGHIGRIERYLKTVLPEFVFPSQRYILNEIGFYDCTADNGTVQVKCGSNDPSVLKAVGVALCDTTTNMPLLCGPSPSSLFRRVRIFLLSGVLAVFGVAGLFTAAIGVYARYCNSQVTTAKTNYLHLLASNNEIRDLITTGNNLSKKIIRVNKLASQPTTWGAFLHQIGSQRPPGLFFERLGSEPVSGTTSKVRIALAGWCEKETIATDFIKLLHQSPLLSEVSLSTIERVNEKQAACKFKILCILSISED